MYSVESALDFGPQSVQIEGRRKPMVHRTTFRPVKYDKGHYLQIYIYTYM